MDVRLEKYMDFFQVEKLKIAVLSIHISFYNPKFLLALEENLLQMSFFFFQLSEFFISDYQKFNFKQKSGIKVKLQVHELVAEILSHLNESIGLFTSL